MYMHSHTMHNNTHECWSSAAPSETSMMLGSQLDASVPQTPAFYRYLSAITPHHHRSVSATCKHQVNHTQN